MPFTPFHFGLHASLALPVRRYIDLPVFVLANIAVDLEPLAVMVLNLNYPLHGYCHILLIGGIIGFLWGAVATKAGRFLGDVMKLLRISSEPSVRRTLISGVLGAWLHIMLDAPLYQDIQPFWPVKSNILLQTVSESVIYQMSSVMCLQAFVFYWRAIRRDKGGLETNE